MFTETECDIGDRRSDSRTWIRRHPDYQARAGAVRRNIPLQSATCRDSTATSAHFIRPATSWACFPAPHGLKPVNEALGVVRADMTLVVDEEGRSSPRAACLGVGHVFSNTFGMALFIHVAEELFDVETQLPGVPGQILELELVLAGEE